MKKLKICRDDQKLFQNELDGQSYYFLRIHKDAFKRMFETQGSTFWLQYITTFRSSILKFHSIRPNVEKPNFAWQVFDELCITLHEKFIEGKFTQAKQFCMDVARVAEKADMFNSILSESIVQNPFFCASTRECFRNVFGDPDSGLYMTSKVVLQTPVFLKFVGSISELLRRWIKNDELHQAEDYWIIPDEILQENYKPFFFEYYLVTYWDDKLPDTYGSNINIPWVKKAMKLRSRFPRSADDIEEFFRSESSSKPHGSKKKQQKNSKTNSKKNPIDKKEEPAKSVDDYSSKQNNKPNRDELNVTEDKKLKVTDDKKLKVMDDKKLKVTDDKKLKVTEDRKLKNINNEDKQQCEISENTQMSEIGKSEIAEKNTIKITSNGTNSKKTKCKKKKVKEGVKLSTEKIDCTNSEADKLSKDDHEEDTSKVVGEFGFHVKKKEDSPITKKLIEAEKYKDEIVQPSKSPKSSKSNNLRNCAHCNKQEVQQKSFKKCKRCKEEKFPEPRYYCGKECQIEDWQEIHREEHLRFSKN